MDTGVVDLRLHLFLHELLCLSAYLQLQLQLQLLFRVDHPPAFSWQCII